MMSNSTVSEMQTPPAVPTRPLRDLSALALMLADGWRIEAPVLARLSWAQRRTGELAYHVIVTRAAQRSLHICHPKVMPRNFVPVSRAKHPVISEQIQFIVKLAAVRDNHSAFTSR